MNYRDDDLWTAAGEYVLGTLSGQELREFTQALQHDQRLQDWVTSWQESLQPLADNTPPVEPPPHVWQHIAGRINEPKTRQSIPRQSINEKPPISLLQRKLRAQKEQYQAALMRWRAFSAVATIACTLCAFALYWALQRDPQPQFDTISIVSAEGLGPLWIVDANIEDRVMRITAISPPTIADDQSHELWLVKPNNAGVVSLGLLPRDGNISVLLDNTAFEANVAALAVSLERKGGSPADVPTGPVLYQGEVTRLNVQEL